MRDKIILYFNSTTDIKFEQQFEELRNKIKAKLSPSIFRFIIFAKFNVHQNSTHHLKIKNHDLPRLRVFRKEESVKLWSFESSRIKTFQQMEDFLIDNLLVDINLE
jgi:hypothetical protein